MDLKYKLLWIENDADWAASIEEDIQEMIEGFGFQFDKKLIPKQQDLNYNEYDLILMDLNLADGNSGDLLIQKIRGLGVYTDVVFYTAGGYSKIKEKVQDLGLEGVYFSDRDIDSFLNKVKSVVLTTIKKVQDLNNLRGLVMAEVSELDAQMEEIIKLYYTTSERMEKFHKHVTKDRENTIHTRLVHDNKEKCDKECKLFWRSKKINEIILESSQRAHAINLILKEIDKDNHIFDKSEGCFCEIYHKKIIETRNNLAHCESIQDQNGNEILKTRKGNIEFSNDDFITIRKDITKYQMLFNKLLEKIRTLP